MNLTKSSTKIIEIQILKASILAPLIGSTFHACPILLPGFEEAVSLRHQMFMMLHSSNSRIYFRLDMGLNILKVSAPARKVDMAAAQQFLEAPDEKQLFVDDLDSRLTGVEVEFHESDGDHSQKAVIVFV